ncbi:16S rRNA (guanine(527)-N(7))-methyltransferase RsmG [Patescibacteria group bacterium]|nr:16S rRNA (guanine(527)-N(7))-methyltransferase RsmG [Patescibacteria group bacterium]
MYHKQYLLRRLTGSLGKILNVAIEKMTPFQVFENYLEREGLKINERKFDKINKFVELLMKKNKVLNLTRIVSEEEVWVKHIFDSLIPIRFLKLEKGMCIMDLGTGGGIPGIPMAILYPSINFVLVDSVQKKVDAVKEFADELGLRNVKVINARAEELGSNPVHRDQYDIVLARALAPLPILIEYGVPLIHLYGYVVAYKGPDYIEELARSVNAIVKLKAEQPRVFHYKLPSGMGERTIICITKKHVTPDTYPRRTGVPKKSPL